MTFDLHSRLDADPARLLSSAGMSVRQAGLPAAAKAAGAEGFVVALLAAITQMAALSPRRQADVGVAMRRTGLFATHDAITAALDELRLDGCVERPLTLLDGGILVSVTMRGIERLATTSYRPIVAGLISGGAR